MLPLRLPTGHSYWTLFLDNHHLGRSQIHATFIYILLCPVSSYPKKNFPLVDDGGMSSSLALSVFHVHVSVVATFLLFAGWGTSTSGLYHFRLTHLWLTKNDFMIEGSLKNRWVIGWNQSNSVKLCYLELRKRYLRYCGGELPCSSH